VRVLLSSALLALLAACATHATNAWNIPAGASRQDVLARVGKPLRIVPLAGGGERLQYSTQPFGHYAFMVDLDAAGRVVRSRQVLTPAEFQRIEPGKWTRADVEREFGPPAWVDSVTSWSGSVLTYRWKEVNEPMFYWVYLDPQGVVQRAHPGVEFINAPSDRF
jgi:hypothetical protein